MIVREMIINVETCVEFKASVTIISYHCTAEEHEVYSFRNQ